MKKTTLKVPEMHCEMCVERINKALDEAGIEHEVKLNHKTVDISDKSKVDEARAKLEDLGFDSKVSHGLGSLF